MRILAEFHLGRVVSVLLENGFLEKCVQMGAEVTVVSPGARLPQFVARYGGSAISWEFLPPRRDLSRMEGYEMKVGRILSTNGFGWARRVLWDVVGQRLACAGCRGEKSLLDRVRPDVVFTPHVGEGFGRHIIATARAARIPTVGNLVSWDNAYRPLLARPEVVTCWSDRNKNELIDLCGYAETAIRVIGAPAFDPYFDLKGKLSRDLLCSRFGFSRQKPIIVFATLGQGRPFMDETGTFAALIDAVDRGLIPNSPQIVLRLHPLSRATYFERFLQRNDVFLSRFTGYVPGMMWTPSREEVMLAGNLLRHADVCISPGSTMTIEPAIFDTPTILPVLNIYTPEEYSAFFEKIWIKRHFREVFSERYVPVVRTVEDLASAVNRYLQDRDWYSDGRKAIRETILGELDGRATDRLAAAVVNAGLRRMTAEKSTPTQSHREAGTHDAESTSYCE